jgi:hypothetical protein
MLAIVDIGETVARVGETTTMSVVIEVGEIVEMSVIMKTEAS